MQNDPVAKTTDLVRTLREFGEMPLEGGRVDPLIETVNGLAHQAADEIERLRDALETAARRFELLALGHPGASAEVGAKEAREAARAR